jgi:hypothetical protein
MLRRALSGIEGEGLLEADPAAPPSKPADELADVDE